MISFKRQLHNHTQHLALTVKDARLVDPVLCTKRNGNTCEAYVRTAVGLLRPLSFKEHTELRRLEAGLSFSIAPLVKSIYWLGDTTTHKAMSGAITERFVIWVRLVHSTEPLFIRPGGLVSRCFLKFGQVTLTADPPEIPGVNTSVGRWLQLLPRHDTMLCRRSTKALAGTLRVTSVEV